MIVPLCVVDLDGTLGRLLIDGESFRYVQGREMWGREVAGMKQDRLEQAGT